MRNILDFPHAFDPPASVVTLDRNYRSTQPILAAANAVIALAAERYAKDLWTDRAHGGPPSLVSVAEEADQARYRRDPRRSPTARRALRSNRRRCCFAPPITAPRSNWS